MRPVIHRQNHLLMRRSYKPKRNLKIWPFPRLNLMLSPTRAGPAIKAYEYETNRIQIHGDGRAPESARNSPMGAL